MQDNLDTLSHTSPEVQAADEAHAPRLSDAGVRAMQGTSDSQPVQERQAIESLIQVESIQPEVWQGLNITERLTALQDVENRMAGVWSAIRNVQYQRCRAR